MSEKYSDSVDALLSLPVNFLDDSPDGSPVVISSRIRLARNLREFNFPPAMSEVDAQTAAKVLMQALAQSKIAGPRARKFIIEELDELDREILFERHLVSRELLTNGNHPAVYVSGDESLSVMVNEEDHLRMQMILPGLQLQRAWQEISALDDQLSCELDFAYDGQLGYLTSCPSNLGTGLRVSVMLHLPALTMENNIKPLERALAKLGLTVRGMFGEGSENLGNFYQISNQSTLGESEMDIIERLSRVIDEVVSHEESARNRLLEQDRNRLLDFVGRSFGLLRHSYILSSKEAFNSLSGVRLGVDMHMFNTLDRKIVNDLFLAISPAHLQKRSGRILSGQERDAFRAETVRAQLKLNGSV